MDKIKKYFSNCENNNENNDDNNRLLLDSLNPLAENDEGFNFGKYFELSYMNRIYYFLAFAGIGVLLLAMSIVCLFIVKIVSFGVLYSLGNICIIVSTLFVVGPVSQFKNLCKNLQRLISAILFIASIIATLVVSFVWHNAIICILLIIVQIGAFAWYMLSYIPYGQRMCCSCIQSVYEF